MNTIMSGEATPAQIGGFLVALRLKGETVEEIAGCAEAMRAHVLAVKPKRRDPRRHRRDRRRRRPDVQHLDRGRARRCGCGCGRREARQPGGVVELGLGRRARGARVQLELPADRIAESIDTLGFGFLFAPTTPGDEARRAGPKELAARTVFNVLGPLTNPAGARAQVVGVYSPDLVKTLAEVLAALGNAGMRSSSTGQAGSTSSRLPARTSSARLSTEGPRTRDRPARLGIERCAPEGAWGGSPDENAAAIREVFAGGNGGRRDAILLNAAGAIAAGGHAERTCARA